MPMLWHCVFTVYLYVCLHCVTAVKVLIHPLFTGQTHIKQTVVQQDTVPVWVHNINSSLNKDIYHYAGKDIVIHESIDSFGAVMWPAVSTSEDIK